MQLLCLLNSIIRSTPKSLIAREKEAADRGQFKLNGLATVLIDGTSYILKRDPTLNEVKITQMLQGAPHVVKLIESSKDCLLLEFLKEYKTLSWLTIHPDSLGKHDQETLNLCLLWIENLISMSASLHSQLLCKVAEFAHGYRFDELATECSEVLVRRAVSGSIHELIECWILARTLHTAKVEEECLVRLHQRFDEVKDVYFFQQLPTNAQNLWTALKAVPSRHFF